MIKVFLLSLTISEALELLYGVIIFHSGKLHEEKSRDTVDEIY